MLSVTRLHLTLLACFSLAPVLGFASTIGVNLSSPLSSGGSVPLTPFSFIYEAGDGDWYAINGIYSATNPPSGNTSILFNVTATYEGNGGINSTPSVGSDTFTVDDLQDYDLATSAYFEEFGTLNGIYTEDASSGISGPPGSSWYAQLFYNGQGLPVLGPFTGPGSASNGSGTNLTGFGSATTLDADFRFTYDFAKGAPAGSGFTSATPEPGGLMPIVSIMALCIGVPAIRRSRLFCRNRESSLTNHSLDSEAHSGS